MRGKTCVQLSFKENVLACIWRMGETVFMRLSHIQFSAVMVTILHALLIWSAFFSAPAYAQTDIGDIIEEIFKTEKPPVPDTDEPDPYQFGRIDNIPVEIHYEAGENSLPANALLIASAYAPAPSNIRRASPVLLGETRLLLSDLPSPLRIIIAAPSAVTQELAYARIEASIIDQEGHTLFTLKTPGKYGGYDAPVLVLTPVGQIVGQTPPFSTNQSTKPDEKFKLETIRGQVRINGKPPKFKGANLVVRLSEDGLAGGNSQTISGEMRQILDGKTAPFAFEFERVIDPARTGIPLALEVWIEDWAGRKTHVTPAPIPFTGPNTRYRVRLDAIGPQVRSKMPKLPKAKSPNTQPPKIKKTPSKNPKPKTQSQAKRQYVNGIARFNAFKGLPRGSVLIAVLERGSRKRPEILAQTRVQLDGLSGDIEFQINTKKVDFSARLKTPVLRIRIEDKNGKLFFSNPGGTRLVPGLNTVTLKTSPNY